MEKYNITTDSICVEFYYWYLVIIWLVQHIGIILVRNCFWNNITYSKIGQCFVSMVSLHTQFRALLKTDEYCACYKRWTVTVWRTEKNTNSWHWQDNIVRYFTSKVRVFCLWQKCIIYFYCLIFISKWSLKKKPFLSLRCT